ncbi:sensor domain-containing diguanylate cyclase [Paraburkholderia phosphatilytica]|uniref:sensor domain-containing diguanylate cyclase n=1 Tax=Paraburkholderia phosphatilytica TaxID=2282883 RepID=UPI000E4AD459|nr:sensor domain-containing diguanylate cyclase [Paraburkholderia phosphatilytica]
MIKLGLTSRLSLLLVLIGVAASGTTGYYAYRANRAMLMQEAEQNLLTSTQILSQRFTAALGDVSDDVLVLATLPSTAAVAQNDDASRAGRERLEQVFVQFMMHHPEYLQIRLITQSHHGLERIRVKRDAQARVVVVPEDQLQEKAQFPYVFDALTTMIEHVYVSPIGLTQGDGTDPSKGRPTITVATPVAEADGLKVGVLVIDADLTRVFERLERDLPADYRVYLANEWGDFLIHPDPSQTFGFQRGRRVMMQTSFPATRPLFETNRTNLTFNGPAGPDQSPIQAFAFERSPFGLVDGNRFIVLGLGRPLSAVLASANALGEHIARIVLISSAVAIILAVLFARALTHPLRILTRASTHVFDDHGVDQLPMTRTDEIGTLARCFDTMRIEIRSQMKALHDRQQELTHLAGHDVLTGLPNRLLFMERLDASMRDATVTGKRLTVMFVDLDGFKQINDRFGHSAGDQTLVIVAQRLRAALRSEDVVGRFGGDEFVILVTTAQSPDDVAEIANRVLATIDEAVPIGVDSVTVGASIGISEFPGDDVNPDNLLAKADAAMYAAKSSTRCRYVSYRELLANGSSSERDRGVWQV